eukprot:g80697.t1
MVKRNWSRAARAIKCVETGEIYPSLAAVGAAIGAGAGNLHQAIRKGYRCKGFHFEYADGGVSQHGTDAPDEETVLEEV